jgi:two-component system, cell cycle response regulator
LEEVGIVATEFHDVALVGFSASEFTTFETFFRLVSSRKPVPFRATRQTLGAKIVMADIFNTVGEGAFDQVLAGMTERQVLITVGSKRNVREWRHLDRPINLNAVLLAIDAAVNVGGATSAASATNTAASAKPSSVGSPPVVPKPVDTAPIFAPTPSAPRMSPVAASSVAQNLGNQSEPSAPSATQELRAFLDRLPAVTKPSSAPSAKGEPRNKPQVAPTPIQPSTVAREASRSVAPSSAPAVATNVTPIRAQSSPASSAGARVDSSPPTPSRTKILVVDDSDVALKFIHNRLSAFGFEVDKSTSGEEALVRVSDGDYAFVFLDVMMEGLDGYQTCKAIKGRRYPSGKAPIVVMLTSRGGTIDKVRGTFAGCDAYLTKPLDETRMLKVLLKHDPDLTNSISTIAAPTHMQSPPLPSSSDPLAASFANLADRA